MNVVSTELMVEQDRKANAARQVRQALEANVVITELMVELEQLVQLADHRTVPCGFQTHHRNTNLVIL